MSFWRRLGSGLAKPARWGSLVAGAVPVLAFPGSNLEFLAWFALVPGLLLMRAAPSAREAGVRAWWFGAGPEYLITTLTVAAFGWAAYGWAMARRRRTRAGTAR